MRNNAITDKPPVYVEVPLAGKLRTTVDPAAMGPSDFRQLTNLRYRDGNPAAVGGMTKINTAALANVKIKNGIQFRKDQVSETHAVVHASDSSDTNPRVYRNDTAIPSAGAFTATALWTDSAGSGTGRFSQGPDGKLLYANGVDACIWGGDEMRVAGYQDYDPNGTYKYDYLDQVSNSLTDANNVATVHRYAQTADANTMLLLHCDGANGGTTFTDSSPTTAHTVTANGNANTSTAQKKFGTASCALDGTGDYLSIPDNADFDLSGGTWTVDMWVYPTSLAAAKVLYYQQTDANNSMTVYFSGGGQLRFAIYAASALVVSMAPSAALTVNAWNHVAVVESGDVYRMFLNGVLVESKSDTDRPANYTGSVYIGAYSDGSSAFAGYIDEVRVSNSARWTSNFSPRSTAYGTGNLTNILIGSTLPLKGINWYVGTANTAAGAGAVYYWDGTNWATVGTVTGLGATAWDGAGKESWTFTSTASTAKLKIVDDVSLYWYKVEVVDCDATTTIYQVTLDAPMQSIKDIWDGELRSCGSFQAFRSSTYNDYTTNVFENAFDSANEATFAKIGSFTFATDALYIGSLERLQGINIGLVGGFTNGNACTLTLQYWNGTSWTTVASDDQTLSNNASFGKSGTVSWTPPAVTSEFKTKLSGVAGKVPVIVQSTGGMIAQAAGRTRTAEILKSGKSGETSKVALYYYKLTFTGNGTTTAFTTEAAGPPATGVHVYYIGGIPAQTDVRQYRFPFTHLDRAWLFDNVDAEPNVGICSADGTAQVFNGQDSFKYNFGDGTKVIAAASIYMRSTGGIEHLAIVCKQKGTYGIPGEIIEQRKPYLISENVGCNAPLTMATGEVEIAENVLHGIAMWQSARGIEMSYGGAPVTVSDDISDKFDPRHANYIGAAVLPTCTGWIDPLYNEYHWVIPGTAEWVYDIRRKKWFEISRGAAKYLYAGFPVFDTNGIAYSYGVDYAGYMYRLENGTTFDGNAIVCTMHLADTAPYKGKVTERTELQGIRLVGVAKTTASTVTVSHYGDGNATASTPTVDGMSMVNTGKRTFNAYRRAKYGPHNFHSVKFVLSDSSETIPFEPLYVAYTFDDVGKDTR